MTAPRLPVALAVIILVVSAQRAAPSTITVNFDAGAGGTSFLYKDFVFTDLAGTGYDGQTISLDMVFSEFLTTPRLTMNLFLSQASTLGVSPTTGFSMSAYLLDDDGLPASGTTAMRLAGLMPAQVLGGNFLPATVGYELTLQGATTMAAGALIDSFVFSGIHVDITMPNTADVLIGSRMAISSFGSGQIFRQPYDMPISVSPNPRPAYTVPESGNTRMLLGLGFLALAASRAAAAGARSVGRR